MLRLAVGPSANGTIVQYQDGARGWWKSLTGTQDMAIYNTASDAANTSVRAFLTKVGEHYVGHGFNTGSGRGKLFWQDIRDRVFGSVCAYCGKADGKLTIEHLIMFNRAEFGLHHPGNIVPCCTKCNGRSKNDAGEYLGWREHLRRVCSERNEESALEERLNRILAHHETGKYAYPKLKAEEVSAIKVIAQSLYQNIKAEADKSLRMYKDLDREFVSKLEE